MDVKNIRSVQQLAAETPISESGWRYHLLHRHENGLDAAVVRLGGRVYLDVERVGEWLETRREVRQAPGGGAM